MTPAEREDERESLTFNLRAWVEIDKRGVIIRCLGKFLDGKVVVSTSVKATKEMTTSALSLIFIRMNSKQCYAS
jgi:hypothetical protein